MDEFLITCEFEVVYVADIDADLPEDENELARFMEEFEGENDVIWTEIKRFTEFSGY